MPTTFLLYTARRISLNGYCFQNAGIFSVLTCFFSTEFKMAHLYPRESNKKKGKLEIALFNDPALLERNEMQEE